MKLTIVVTYDAIGVFEGWAFNERRQIDELHVLDTRHRELQRAGRFTHEQTVQAIHSAAVCAEDLARLLRALGFEVAAVETRN